LVSVTTVTMEKMHQWASQQQRVNPFARNMVLAPAMDYKIDLDTM